MLLLLRLICISLLLVIMVEDMRSRSVHWFWFPVLAMSLLLLRVQQGQPWLDIGRTSLVSLAFLGVQLLLVVVYFSLKHRQFVNITEGMLGWGDILFLMVIALYLPLFNYIVFYIVSLIVVLMVSLMYARSHDRKQLSIPLAGGQALLLAAWMLAGWLIPALNITSDEALLYKFLS